MVKSSYGGVTMKKGRHGKIVGESPAEMVQLYKDGNPVNTIAERYGVSAATVYNYLDIAKVARHFPKKGHIPVRWKLYNCSWPFSERSTRNCINARVRADEYKGQPRGEVFCRRGRQLNERKPSMSVERVLITPRFVCRTCELCTEFDHDRRKA